MYDALTTRYTFSCPIRGETRVRLSEFRTLDRLPGAGHPAVFQVVFDCPCGCEHPGLVSDVELDWAPLGHSSERFLNLMTARFESAEEELADLAVRRILAGQWPWTFYCYPERRPRPVFPSSFFLLAPGDGSLGIAVRCPAIPLRSKQALTCSSASGSPHCASAAAASILTSSSSDRK